MTFATLIQLMIGGIASADPVGFAAVAPGEAGRSHFGRHLDQYRAVGQQSVASDPVQFQQVCLADSTAAALVGAT